MLLDVIQLTRDSLTYSQQVCDTSIRTGSETRSDS
jgi:hypothetical protein